MQWNIFWLPKLQTVWKIYTKKYIRINFHAFVLFVHSKEFFHTKRFEKFIRYSLEKETTYLTLSQELQEINL